MANVAVHAIIRDIFARESVTIGASSTALTAATYAPGTTAAPTPHASWVLITVETDQVRWNAVPDTDADANDSLLNVGDALELHGINNIRNFRAIRVTGNATLRVQYAR